MDWKNTLQEIEDILIPHYKFDIYERGMYFYLLNKTRIRDLKTAIIPLSKISKALKCSDWQSRKTIRQLADKGCIELEQTRKGHSVKLFLPGELDISISTIEEKELNIEDIDFFTGRMYIYEAVAKRMSRNLGLTHSDIEDIIDYLCTVGNHRKVHFLWRPNLKDPSDDFVLELAVESECNYIVTHNIKDFKGIKKFNLKAITPQELLRKIGEIS